jgi:hypothetical protein
MRTSISQRPWRSTATAIANGTGSIARPARTSVGPPGKARAKPASTRVAATPSSSHLSCWRASPVDIRQRTTSDASASAVAATRSTPTTTTVAGWAASDRPMGLTRPRNSRGKSCWLYGVIAQMIDVMSRVANEIHSPARSRGDATSPAWQEMREHREDGDVGDHPTMACALARTQR